MAISGSELVVKALIKEQVDFVFAYPGGQVIDLFDRLYQRKEFRVILPRHEQGLIHAADGYARATGKVGVCIVTSGPGATNLVTGIATANFDSSPIICFTGQVPTDLMGNDAFQEVDIVGITRPVTKYAVTVSERADLGGIIKKAFTIAQSGKPGVVVIDLPKNIQKEYGSEDYPAKIDLSNNTIIPATPPENLSAGIKLLEAAQRPLFLIGGGVHVAQAQVEMAELLEVTKIPAVTTIMGKGAVPSNHKRYIGNIGIHGSAAANYAISHCDVLFAVGCRFNDRITGKLSEFGKNMKIIHADIDPASISKNIDITLSIVGDAKKMLNEMLKTIDQNFQKTWFQTLHNLVKTHSITMDYPGMTAEIILKKINRYFPQSIVTTDVGQNQLWATQFLALDEQRKLITSGGLGTMGFGLPAALGAKLGNPDKTVIVITGDGGFQMNMQELATAVFEKIPLIICIFNNGCLGNVRQWQELFFEKRYSFTSLIADEESNGYQPDFLKIAESYGISGFRVKNCTEIDRVLKEAKKLKNVPVLIEFLIPQEQNVFPIIPPGSRLDDMIFS